MKVYAPGGTAQGIAELGKFCSDRGWQFVRLKGAIGRPRMFYPVQKVLDTYSQWKTVRAAARALDIPPPTVSRILKRAGVLESS